MRGSPRDRIELRLRLALAFALLAAVVYSLSLWRANAANKKLSVLRVEAVKTTKKVAKLRKEVQFLSSLKPERVTLYGCSDAVFILDKIVRASFPLVGYNPKLVWNARGGQLSYVTDLDVPGFEYVGFEIRLVGIHNYGKLRNLLKKLQRIGIVMTSAEYDQNRLVLKGRLYCRG